MADSYTTPDRWPWPGDSKIGQIQRIARAYRDLCHHLIHGAIPNPAATLAAEDAEWQRLGHHWINPTDALQPEPDQWLTVRDCAHYVSQYYPCTEKDIHNWIHRGLLEYRQQMNGRRVEKVEVRWGSVLEMDQRRTRSKTA
jgi:hypothetical protein